MEKDAYYFPHFSNARHDRKIKRLRKEMGIEGYGVYFMLLEVLRDQIDFNYPIQDIDLLAEEFGTSEQKVRVVICNYQLFKLDEKELFFSPNLIVYLDPYLKMKEQRRIAGIQSGLIRKQKANERLLNGCSTDVQRMLNENEQSKVKESKVKEKKDIYTENVSLFKNEYQKLIEEYGEQQTKKMIDTLNNYKGANGKTYKSDYLAILNWVVEKVGAIKKGEEIKDRYRRVD